MSAAARPSRPGPYAATAACSLLASMAMDCGEASPTAGTYISIPDTIVASPDQRSKVERGLFFASENRRDPRSRLIAVHFLRFPALHGEKGRPPVFLLDGGPGDDSDFTNPQAYYSPSLVERLRRTRDVVYVSQRGNPKARGLVPALYWKLPGHPMNLPGSAALRREGNRVAVKAVMQEWSDRRVDLRGYDILNIVDDVHELRAALGYDRIVLRGCSFGSQWSLSYLKRRRCTFRSATTGSRAAPAMAA